jgi:hypothetical protein
METSGLMSAMIGFIAGHLLSALLISWGRAVVEVRRVHESSHPGRMVVLTSLFNAGPWALVAAAIFAYYEYSQPWAPWFFGGAFATLLLFGTLAVVTIKRQR